MKCLMFIIFTLQFALLQWSDPVNLFSSAYSYSVKDIYTDPSTGITHILWCTAVSTSMNYWQINFNHELVYRSKLTHPSITRLFSGKIIGANNGANLYVTLSGKRACDSEMECYDQWFTESENNGKIWTAPVSPPRASDRCDRLGDDLLVIVETGQIYIFYHKECIGEGSSLVYVTRTSGSKSFSKEKVIPRTSKRQIRPSITSCYTMNSGRPLVHIFWGDVGENTRPIMYSFSANNGEMWSMPTSISENDFYAGFLTLVAVANSAVSNIIVGTYAVTPPSKLRMFYKKNMEGFSVVEGTNSEQNTFTWEYELNSMAVCGTRESPSLIMLSQTDENMLQYSIWNMNSMTATRPGNPFLDILRVYGAQVTCYNIGGDKLLVTIVALLRGKDGEIHMVSTRKIQDIPKDFTSRYVLFNSSL